MKVFLSHSTKDADFVEKLALTLESNEFGVFRCEVDIDKLENFVAKINDGLVQSDICLLIWTPNAAQSAWTKEEWTAAMARQVEGQKMRVGTVLLRDDPAFPIPPLLKTKVWFDARSDQAAGIREVMIWLKERQNLQRLSGRKAPVYLPEYRPRDFVGRSAHLARLTAEFSPDPGKFLLFGEPGSGKSTIALRFAWDAQKDLDAVIWQTCGQRPLDTITAELVARLPIEASTLPPDQQRAAAREWLRARPSLVILDDVWSAEVIELEPKGACSVLYTSRQKSLPGLVPKQTSKVEKFTDAEAEALFHTHLDEAFSKDEVDSNRKPLLDFAARVEMLPIAVSVGASLLRDMSAMSLSKAVSKLNVSALSDGVKNVNALFAQAIDSQPEREQKLLAACAVCVPEGFWLPLAAQIAELTEDDADEAANALVRGSLLRVLDRDRRRFQLHALLREQLRTRAASDGQLKKSLIHGFVSGHDFSRAVEPSIFDPPRGLQSAPPARNDLSQPPLQPGEAPLSPVDLTARTTLADLQDRHASALEQLFKDWETRWRDCRQCLQEVIPAAEFLWAKQEKLRQGLLTLNSSSAGLRVGELDLALRILQQEELFWQGLDGREAEDARLRSLGNQARTLVAWERFAEALPLLQKVERASLALADNATLLRTYGLQAMVLKGLGRLDESLALHEKEEAIAIELGDKHQLQASYGNQALALRARGQLDNALALFRKVEAIAIELDDKDSLQKTYDGQALILMGRKRYDEALALLKKQEEICLELGNMNDLAACYGNWAEALRSCGRLEDALSLIQRNEAVALQLAHQGYLGTCYWQWSRIARDQRDSATQKQKLQRALTIFNELNLPRERDAIQAELDHLPSADT